MAPVALKSSDKSSHGPFPFTYDLLCGTNLLTNKSPGTNALDSSNTVKVLYNQVRMLIKYVGNFALLGLYMSSQKGKFIRHVITYVASYIGIC